MNVSRPSDVEEDEGDVSVGDEEDEDEELVVSGDDDAPDRRGGPAHHHLHHPHMSGVEAEFFRQMAAAAAIRPGGGAGGGLPLPPHHPAALAGLLPPNHPAAALFMSQHRPLLGGPYSGGLGGPGGPPGSGLWPGAPNPFGGPLPWLPGSPFSSLGKLNLYLKFFIYINFDLNLLSQYFYFSDFFISQLLHEILALISSINWLSF